MRKSTLADIVICLLFIASVSLLFFVERREAESLTVASLSRPTTVIIDAGHGGEDGGAVGGAEVFEKDINLAISKKLELVLNLCGINTEMTRREDTSLGSDGFSALRQKKVSDMKQRVKMISNTPNATLISIHQNSFPQDSGCFGAQVFFSDNNLNSELLAKHMQKALKSGISNNNKREPKLCGDNIYLLKNVNCPSILVECGFLTNNTEFELLQSEEFQTKLSVCIASGFLKYQKEK